MNDSKPSPRRTKAAFSCSCLELAAWITHVDVGGGRRRADQSASSFHIGRQAVVIRAAIDLRWSSEPHELKRG
jgi:hypothetical protein